jgi:1-acyl-sn-glycerol-3-phosphate acyltransferase
MFERAVRKVWYWICGWACRLFCIFFFNFRAYGKENVPREGAFLLVSNHQSYLDPILCGISFTRQMYFLARDSLFSNWFFGWLISSLNSIPVKRGEADFSMMKEVISRLREGYGVCLFPEGTRTRDGKIAAFKPGFGLLCRRGNAAIVPVMIDGAFECWPRFSKIFSPGSVVVWYGKAITVEEAKSMGDRELAKTVTDRLRRMQTEFRVKRGKEPYEY